MKRDSTKIFIDEIYNIPPRKFYSTNIKIYNHINEIWYIDLADMIDYETSNKKRVRYVPILIDFFSKYTWAIRIKNKSALTKTNEISNILKSSKT